MTNRIDHTDHDHEATSAARAACRKALAEARDARVIALSELLATFATKAFDYQEPAYWVFYAASRFAQVHTDDEVEAAGAVYDYFAPSGDEAQDDRRRRNGYLVTTSPAAMLSTTLHAAS